MCVCIVYMCMYVDVYTYIYMYIYRERDSTYISIQYMSQPRGAPGAARAVRAARGRRRRRYYVIMIVQCIIVYYIISISYHITLAKFLIVYYNVLHYVMLCYIRYSEVRRAAFLGNSQVHRAFPRNVDSEILKLLIIRIPCGGEVLHVCSKVSRTKPPMQHHVAPHRRCRFFRTCLVRNARCNRVTPHRRREQTQT